MSGVVQDLLVLLQQWRSTIHANYGVNPYLYLVLTTVSAPPFYYALYRLTKALATKQRSQVSLWSSVFLGASALPYLYVLVSGSNMPWWIYLILGALLAQGTVSLVWKLTLAGRTSAGAWRSALWRRHSDGESARSPLAQRLHLAALATSLPLRLRFARGGCTMRAQADG